MVNTFKSYFYVNANTIILYFIQWNKIFSYKLIQFITRNHVARALTLFFWYHVLLCSKKVFTLALVLIRMLRVSTNIVTSHVKKDWYRRRNSKLSTTSWKYLQLWKRNDVLNIFCCTSHIFEYRTKQDHVAVVLSSFFIFYVIIFKQSSTTFEKPISTRVFVLGSQKSNLKITILKDTVQSM